jgi:Fe-S-cluster containining protein
MQDCYGCGKCCVLTDPYLDVEIFSDDFVNEMPYLLIEKNGTKYMRRKDDGSCVCLDENKRCSIYVVRPQECREFNQDHPLCKKLIERKNHEI